MTLFRAASVFVACLFSIPPAVSADGATEVSAVLDFSDPQEGRADAFFASLRANAGKVVRLKLEIVPRQAPDERGYVLTSPSGEETTCGQGRYGVVDNLRTEYQLNFSHPENHHTVVVVNVGNRLAYPFHALACGVEEYTAVALTHLHVSGDFVVASADIPTAFQLILFPYHR